MAAEGERAGSAPPPLERLVEALLFVGGEPLTPARAAALLRGVSEARFAEAVAALNAEYRRQGRPYAVQLRGDGYAMELRPPFRPVLEKLYGGPRAARLSPAALDVLALVAYRQPATKAELDAHRGADCGGLLRQLVRRGLVAVALRGGDGQHDVAYGTTPRFLDLFDLRGLDDLPRPQDLQRL